MHSLDDIGITLRLSFEKASIIFSCKISWVQDYNRFFIGRKFKHDILQLKIVLAFSKDKRKEIAMPSKECMK